MKQKLNLREWASLATAGSGLLYALMQAMHCKVERMELQQAIQVLAEVAFK